MSKTSKANGTTPTQEVSTLIQLTHLGKSASSSKTKSLTVVVSWKLRNEPRMISVLGSTTVTFRKHISCEFNGVFDHDAVLT